MALADTARLIASLELQDKFSATAAKYEKALGSMERRTSTAEKVGFQIGQGARNTINNLRTIGVVAAGAIAFNVAAGIKSLGELATVQNQTAAAIESTGAAANVTADHIREQAEAMEDLTTIDDKAIQAGQNMLLTFTNIRNEVGEGNDIFDQATEAVLDLSAAMGTEPKNAALQLGKALNDPVRGLTALRRVGIQFTEQQEEQIQKMVESGRTLQAQKVIIAELNKEFGGSAAAFGQGPAATMRRFGDAVEGAQQALATGFLPLMEKVSVLVQDALGDPKVIANITAFGEGLAEGAEAAVDIAMNLPWAQIGAAGELLGTGAKALLTAFTSLPPWVQTAVLTGWGLNKLTGGALGKIAGTLLGAGIGSLRGSSPATPMYTREVGIPGGGAGGGIGGLLTKLLGGAAIGAAIVGGIEAVTSIQRNQAAGRLDIGSAADLAGGPAGLIGRMLSELIGIHKEVSVGGASSTPIGQFNPANQGGVQPVKIVEGGGAFNAIEIGIKHTRDAVRKGLKENDIHAARVAQKQLDTLNKLRDVVGDRISDIIPHLGKVSTALSVANRNLEQGNARQRELAQGIREARDRIGSGFQASNEQLRAIRAKDFSPNVNVRTDVTTQVSINDIIRVYEHAYVVGTGAGFGPGPP